MPSISQASAPIYSKLTNTRPRPGASPLNEIHHILNLTGQLTRPHHHQLTRPNPAHLRLTQFASSLCRAATTSPNKQLQPQPHQTAPTWCPSRDMPIKETTLLYAVRSTTVKICLEGTLHNRMQERAHMISGGWGGKSTQRLELALGSRWALCNPTPSISSSRSG